MSLLANLAFAAPVPVAALLPMGEIHFVDTGKACWPAVAASVEFGQDSFVWHAVVEHGVDAVTDVFRKACDFTGAVVH